VAGAVVEGAGMVLSGTVAFVCPEASGAGDLVGSVLGAAGPTAGEGPGLLSLRLAIGPAGRDAGAAGETGAAGRTGVAGAGGLEGAGRSAGPAGAAAGSEATDMGAGRGGRSVIDAGRRTHINSPALASTATAATIHIH
jgi:pilus assembly protein FimV